MAFVDLLTKDIAESMQLLKSGQTKEAVAKWLAERLAEKGWIKPEGIYTFGHDLYTDGASIGVRAPGQHDDRRILPKGTRVVVLRMGDARNVSPLDGSRVDTELSKLFDFR